MRKGCAGQLEIAIPGEPFDHKKRAHTALVHEKIFSRPYAVFTAIRIAIYNFTFCTVFQGHSTLFRSQMHNFSRPNLVFTAISWFHGQTVFSKPFGQTAFGPFLRSNGPPGLTSVFGDRTSFRAKRFAGQEGRLKIAILPQFLAIEPHFVRKGSRDDLQIAILPHANLISCEKVARDKLKSQFYLSS